MANDPRNFGDAGGALAGVARVLLSPALAEINVPNDTPDGVLVFDRVPTDIIVSAAPIALSVGDPIGTVLRNGTLTIPITIARSGSFIGAVTISVLGLPAGVTASALTIASGSTAGTITLTATGLALLGTAILTLVATGASVTAGLLTYTLTVQSSVTATIALSASSVTITAGNTATLPVTVTRSGGFTGDVAVTIAGLPAGVTAGALTITTGTTSGTITLTATNGATLGAASVTLTGAGAGVSNATTTASVTVVAVGATTSMVPLRLMRLDGLSGTTIVEGGLPLKRGQLMPGAENTVSLWSNGSEMAVRVDGLPGRYDDGSYISVRLQTDPIAIATNTDVIAEARIGAARTLTASLNRSAARYRFNDFVVQVDTTDTRYLVMPNANTWPSRGQIRRSEAGTRLSYAMVEPFTPAVGFSIAAGGLASFHVILGSDGPYLVVLSGTGNGVNQFRDPATGQVDGFTTAQAFANVFAAGTIQIKNNGSTPWVMGTDGWDRANLQIYGGGGGARLWNAANLLRVDLPMAQSWRLPATLILPAGTATNSTTAESHLVATQMMNHGPTIVGLTRAQSEAQAGTLGLANIAALNDIQAKTTYLYVTGQMCSYFHANADYDPGTALLMWYARTGDYLAALYGIAWANMAGEWMTDETQTWVTHRSATGIDEPYFDVDALSRCTWLTGYATHVRDTGDAVSGYPDMVARATDVFIKRARVGGTPSVYEFLQYMPVYGVLESRLYVRVIDGTNWCARLDAPIRSRLMAAKTVGQPTTNIYNETYTGVTYTAFTSYDQLARWVVDNTLLTGVRAPDNPKAFAPFRPDNITVANGCADWTWRRTEMKGQIKPFMTIGLGGSVLMDHYDWVHKNPRILTAVGAMLALVYPSGTFWRTSGTFGGGTLVFDSSGQNTALNWVNTATVSNFVCYDANEANGAWTVDGFAPLGGGTCEPPDYRRSATAQTVLIPATGYPGSFLLGQNRNTLGQIVLVMAWYGKTAGVTTATTTAKTWMGLLRNGDAAQCDPTQVTVAEKQYTETFRWSQAAFGYLT